MDTGSKSGDAFPAPFVALNLPSNDASAGTGAGATAGAGAGALSSVYPTHKASQNKAAERILRLDLDNAFKPVITNSIKEFIAPVDTPYHQRAPVEIKVATSLSTTTTAAASAASAAAAGVSNQVGRSPLDNGLNFGPTTNPGNNNPSSSGMFEFGGMALLSYQV